MCECGLHASVRLIDALKYAPCTTLHRVECGGEIIESNDKLVCDERTIIASAEMLWALVEFAEDCAKRAAAHAAAYATKAARYAAYYARAAAYAADAARYAAYYAVDAADAANAARNAADAAYATEREHQNSTLELWFECMKGQPC